MFCSRCGTEVQTSSKFCPTCGLDLTTITGAGQGATAMMQAAPQQDETDIVRQALKDEYELEKELGRGGMAVVYKARDKQLDREVAIKVLPFSLSFDAEFVERFQREARTAGRLEHPNIIPIYRVGKSGRVIYFVMKFIRGKSLSAVIEARGAMPVPEIKRLLIEATRALGYAHKHGIVHRDIKPDNIMFDELGQAIVTDFGIAKAQSGAKLTGTGMSIGTPHYMSPEQARAQNLDGRSDVYSLGVVAYQCLTGHVPFDGEDSFSIGYKHIMEELPVPPLETAEQRDLFGVIQRMMAKKPDDRFQSAEELVAALEGVHGAPLAAPDLATMKTVAMEPMKPPAAKATPPAGIGAGTTPLPRASAPQPKPKLEEEEEKPKPKPPERKPPVPRPRPPEKSRAPIYVAAALGVAVLGLAGYYFGMMRPQQQREQARRDSILEAQRLAQAGTSRTPGTSTPVDSPAAGAADTAKPAGQTSTPSDSPTSRPGTSRTPDRPGTSRTPTTTPPAREGTLRLGGTLPPRASVTVDGQTKTPPTITLAAGRHRLRITANGYQPFDTNVTIAADRSTAVKVTMLALTSTPGTQPGGTPGGTPTTPTQPGGTPTPPGPTTPTTPGARPAECTSNPGFSERNLRQVCYDARPRLRVAPIMPVPGDCAGAVRPVTVRVQVSATGEVMGTPSVVNPSNCASFQAAATSQALDFTFQPATKGGQPVIAWVQVRIQPQGN